MRAVEMFPGALHGEPLSPLNTAFLDAARRRRGR
jgi:hypothetical protein